MRVEDIQKMLERVKEAPAGERILETCLSVATALIQKNIAYGNSALDPVRIFSQADSVEQIRVRIDDKLSRLMRGHVAGEDVKMDLLGYLVLLIIAEEARAVSPVDGDVDAVLAPPLDERRAQAHAYRFAKAHLPHEGVCQECGEPTDAVVCGVCVSRKGFHRFGEEVVERSSEGVVRGEGNGRTRPV